MGYTSDTSNFYVLLPLQHESKVSRESRQCMPTQYSCCLHKYRGFFITFYGWDKNQNNSLPGLPGMDISKLLRSAINSSDSLFIYHVYMYAFLFQYNNQIITLYAFALPRSEIIQVLKTCKIRITLDVTFHGPRSTPWLDSPLFLPISEHWTIVQISIHTCIYIPTPPPSDIWTDECKPMHDIWNIKYGSQVVTSERVWKFELSIRLISMFRSSLSWSCSSENWCFHITVITTCQTASYRFQPLMVMSPTASWIRQMYVGVGVVS